MTTIDLAKAARQSNRPRHAVWVEQHSVNVAIEQGKRDRAAKQKRRNAMVRIIGSIVVLLSCFGYAIGKGWILLPQATTVAIGMLAFAALFAEAKSD